MAPRVVGLPPPAPHHSHALQAPRAPHLRGTALVGSGAGGAGVGGGATPAASSVLGPVGGNVGFGGLSVLGDASGGEESDAGGDLDADTATVAGGGSGSDDGLGGGGGAGSSTNFAAVVALAAGGGYGLGAGERDFDELDEGFGFGASGLGPGGGGNDGNEDGSSSNGARGDGGGGRGGDTASVASRGAAKRLAASVSGVAQSHSPSTAWSGSRRAGLGSAFLGPGHGLGVVGFAHASSTAIAAGASGLAPERLNVVLRVSADPLSLLGSGLGTALAGTQERRAHFLGQIEGAAAFHDGFGLSLGGGLSGVSGGGGGSGAGASGSDDDAVPPFAPAASAASFDSAVRRGLARGAATLLVLAQVSSQRARAFSSSSTHANSPAIIPPHSRPRRSDGARRSLLKRSRARGPQPALPRRAALELLARQEATRLLRQTRLLRRPPRWRRVRRQLISMRTRRRGRRPATPRRHHTRISVSQRELRLMSMPSTMSWGR